MMNIRSFYVRDLPLENFESFPKNELSEDSVCWPNICKCQNGIPAASNYNYLDSMCGLVSENSKENHHREKRFTNGLESRQTDWPFIVQLFSEQKIGGLKIPFCTAAVVNPKFILTAAHCLYDKSQRKKHLPFYYRRNSDWLQTSKIAFEGKALERSYEYNDGSPINDIALIKLLEAIRFDDNIRPICLTPSAFEQEEVGEELFLAGFDGESNIIHTTFQQTDCKSTNTESRNRIQLENTDSTNANSTFCVTSTRKSNTCAGDSGSPLMRAVMDDVNGLSVERWYVVGILSTGPENCDQDTAYESVFTRVSEYDDWIAGLQN